MDDTKNSKGEMQANISSDALSSSQDGNDVIVETIPPAVGANAEASHPSPMVTDSNLSAVQDGLPLQQTFKVSSERADELEPKAVDITDESDLNFMDSVEEFEPKSVDEYEPRDVKAVLSQPKDVPVAISDSQTDDSGPANASTEIRATEVATHVHPSVELGHSKVVIVDHQSETPGTVHSFEHAKDPEGTVHFEKRKETGNLSDGAKSEKTLPTSISENAVGKQIVSVNGLDRVMQGELNRGLVDTAAPFESVKEAVTKFGGIVDWKAHKIQTIERRKHVELQLQRVNEEIPKFKKQSEAAEEAKVQVLKEVESTRRLIEELKLNLERAQTEMVQAKQDSELAQLRVEEMERGIADEASVVAKTQLEVAKSRHEAAIEELKSVKNDLQMLHGEYTSLVNEKNSAVERANESVSMSKETEKVVEDLTLELITAKESLEAAHAAHLEAEEQRIGAAMAREQDSLNWEKELKQAEDEVRRLNEQILSTKDLKLKLDAASALLTDLKAELASYMEAKLNQGNRSIEKDHAEGEPDIKAETETQASIDSATTELQEVRNRVEKAKDAVNCLRVAAVSLKSELQKEKAALAVMQQREGMASVAVASLEAEIDRIRSEIELVQMKEKESRDKMVELPKALQQAAQEADQAKLTAKSAREELRKATEEAEQIKAGVRTMESRLHAALKERDAAKASEGLALAAIKALQESELAMRTGSEDLPSGVKLSLEEYYELSKKAHDAEEQANARIASAASEIEVAKDSERKSLKKLEEANREAAASKEAMRAALDKAEKAKEGKLAIEQELRKWRAEHEQRRKATDVPSPVASAVRDLPMAINERKEAKSFDGQQAANAPSPGPFTVQKGIPSEKSTESASPDMKSKKKKSILPRFVMFLSKKKTSK